MLNTKMYGRCPADPESMTNPRIFVCGQIIEKNDFEKTVSIKIHDPFQYQLFFDGLPKGTIKMPEASVEHCSMFVGSEVVYKNKVCTVLSDRRAEDGYFYYYIQTKDDKRILQVSERDIIASFNNGRVDPSIQLKRYEFQNPCWYIGRSIVSRSMNILENSIYGFKDLAGCKIYLLPHQINTIMRCLQEKPCRYMLADEVGMGKTIEAISVLKIFLKERSKMNVLIVVPETLKEQWKTELLFKFNIVVGKNQDKNIISLKSIGDLSKSDLEKAWDFVIIDEVHRYLSNEIYYEMLHGISALSQNELLLSATPVQQRKEEYLDLLRLLMPKKYDKCNIEQFSKLIEKQSHIIQKTVLILDDLGDLEEEINNCKDEEENPHYSEDCKELYEGIHDDLEEICDELNDSKLNILLDNINYESDDLGVYAIKVIISYLCSNYQIESNIIRNRRKILEITEDEERLLPVRELTELTYSLDEDKNIYEAISYQLLANWIIKNTSGDNIVKTIKPLLSAFFSSPWAYLSELKRQIKKGAAIESNMIENAKKWFMYEEDILDHITDILDDPYIYEDRYSTRIVSILNMLSEELYDQKIVLFTNYSETFEVYRKALSKTYNPSEISFFGKSLSQDEIEINAYKFQNETDCRIMLCDYTGGEGRNFQCADYIIHIDLPWDASMIEQRIGRLDRLERDPARPIVHSVVVHTSDTFEAALFDFWNRGLKIFTQSLSGMEIIMKDINEEIVSAIQEDFRYGLFDRIPQIIELADQMRETVRKEQNYDAAAFMFKPMYAELKRLIDYYAQNENELFAETMTQWANLAGFKGHENENRIMVYSPSSFSPRSAINSQLIPPHWGEYLSNNLNKVINNIQIMYDNEKQIQNNGRSIKGTFVRKQAIENDYLHFFAPGDDVFECVVNNALQSCKGQSCAFASPSSINWCGLVFTWSLYPDETALLDQNISIYSLSPYRNYLTSEQVVVPVSLVNDEDCSDTEIIREYTRIINEGIYAKKVVHLGKRSNNAKFLKNVIGDERNIKWFKQKYSREEWSDIVSEARKLSSERALAVFKKRSNIRGALDEMERVLSARAANSTFYGMNDSSITALKKEQAVILQSIKRPRRVLDSAAFIWMVKADNE